MRGLWISFGPGRGPRCERRVTWEVAPLRVRAHWPMPGDAARAASTPLSTA